MNLTISIKSKRGQVQLMETITVLFIFFVLIGLAIIFYAKYQEVELQERKEELQQARALTTTLRAVYLPELQCTKGSSEPEDYCIDLLKARYFRETLDPYLEDYYFDLFSYSEIKLHRVYPILGGEEVITIYQKEKEKFTNLETTFFVVALRDDLRGETNPAYGYGYLEVKVYS